MEEATSMAVAMSNSFAAQTAANAALRKWDAHNSFGKYLSTEFILSDAQGNSIQCSTRSNSSHRFVAKLVEGSVYSMKKFSVVPNRERYRIRKTDEFMISLEGYSIVKKVSCPTDGFVRYPFELMPLEDVDLNDSTYLVDVVGCVMEVGKIRTTSGGSELVDFEIMNERDAWMRVTLWSPLCSELAVGLLLRVAAVFFWVAGM